MCYGFDNAGVYENFGNVEKKGFIKVFMVFLFI